MKIKAVHIEAARLVTIEEGFAEGLRGSVLVKCKGAFVRLRPPPGTSAKDVELARKECQLGGARAVRVVHPNEPAVVTDTATEGGRLEEPERGIREVVMAMADEANTSDRGALRTALERHLSAAGI